MHTLPEDLKKSNKTSKEGDSRTEVRGKRGTCDTYWGQTTITDASKHLTEHESAKHLCFFSNIPITKDPPQKKLQSGTLKKRIKNYNSFHYGIILLAL